MKLRPGNAQIRGARETQEDAFAFSDLDDERFAAHGGVLAVVADGMGGLAHGGVASHAAVRAFLDAYLAKTADEAVGEALDRSIGEANAAVQRLATEAGVAGAMGTTLVAAVGHSESLHWISVGDSRAYLLRDGRLSQITTDHVYASDLREKVERGLLDEEAAASDPEREAITSFLGVAEIPSVDRNVRAFPLRPGDRIVLATDGLYRSIAESEIAAAGGADPHQMCETLVQRIAAAGAATQDNATIAVLACDADDGAAIAGRARTPVLPARLAILLAVLAGAAAVGAWRWATLGGAASASAPAIAAAPAPAGAGAETAR